MGQHDEGAEAGGVRNADLHDKFRAYCETAVTMLNCRLDESEDDGREFVASLPGFTLLRTGSVEPSDTEETDWRAVLRRWGDAVKGTEESKSVVQALKDDETVARHLGARVGYPGWRALIPGSDTWVEGFLIEVLHEGGGQYQDAVFDKLYSRMEAFFYKEQFEIRVLAPLGGFDTEGDPIELRPGLRIVRLTQEDMDEIARAWHLSAPRLLYSKPWAGMRRWGFELYLEMDKQVDVTASRAGGDTPEDLWFRRAGKRFEEACSALKVYKKGDIWHDLMLNALTSWHPSRTSVIGGLWNLSRVPWEGYALSNEDATGFRKFWKRWGKAEHWQDLEVAVRRFSMGCERLLPEDALLDYVIALEALLLPGADGEYRYRLTLRGAALAGKGPLDRVAAKRNLRQAYDIRSSIVHGGEDDHETVIWYEVADSGKQLAKKPVKLRVFVDSIGDYVRSLVEELGERVEKMNLRSVLDDVDDAIIEGCVTPKQS